MEKERTSNGIKAKKFLFIAIVIGLIAGATIIVKNSKFKALEGYMYSFASDITGNATSGDATSCDATSSDATSSNATSCNATSSNATNNVKEVVISEEIKQKIEVESENEKVEYDNSKITSEIIEEISTNDNLKVVTINLDNDTKIDKEIFEAIKGKSKKLIINSNGNQIIFYGEIITESKEIDANIEYNLVSENLKIKDVLSSGIVVNFLDNGNLPGNVEVRIKITDKIKKALQYGKVYVYFYNENGENFTEIETIENYTADSEYLEFTINHNSKYVMTNEILKEVEQDNIDEVSFLESHRIYVMIIGISIITIVIVTVMLIVDKKTKGKANKEE